MNACLIRVFFLVISGFSLLPSLALAVPSYARQTGLDCAACHTSFPELTPFGREFKLNGYTLGERQLLPLAAMMQFSITNIAKNHDNTGVKLMLHNNDPQFDVLSMSNSIQYFPLISVQLFPLFCLVEHGFCDA